MTTVAMIVFAVVGLCGGAAILRWSTQLAKFFEAAAKVIYPERLTKRVYTARNMKWAGYGYIAFGVLALCIFAGRVLSGAGLH